jgi:transcriptional regulator with XRE-family HTH domain
MTTYDLDSFAGAVLQARLDRHWSKEEAARRAGISAITWKRVEDGLPVQDVKRRSIESTLQLDTAAVGEPLTAAEADEAIKIVRRDLNPDLAGFTDRELLQEVEGRLLLLAARLEAGGERVFFWTLDADGGRVLTSHAGMLTPEQ